MSSPRVPLDLISDVGRRVLASTLRRCRGQFARPVGVDPGMVEFAKEHDLLRFNEWPSGHYEITPAGLAFLATVPGQEEGA
jgi:hypothetical protein